jgi:hypothetical protein
MTLAARAATKIFDLTLRIRETMAATIPRS